VTTRTPTRRDRSLRSNVGQTTTEYLMIMGLITSVFIAVNNTMYTPFHLMMQNVLQCIADGTVNQVACEGVSSSAGNGGSGGAGGLLNLLNGVMNQITGSVSNMLGSPRPSGGGGESGGQRSPSQAVPMEGNLVQRVNVSSTTEQFTDPEGATLETTQLCTTDIGLLNAHRQTAGAAFVVVDIESEQRPQVNGGLRIPISEVAPGRWRAQMQVTGDELQGDSYCVSVRNPQGTATVTNVRFTSGLEQ
jgi:hypothetical protein